MTLREIVFKVDDVIGTALSYFMMGKALVTVIGLGLFVLAIVYIMAVEIYALIRWVVGLVF